MAALNPSMRPRVKPDTYIVADGCCGVYLQNNERAFRLEGRTIGQWLEKLLPIFTGEHTLEELTDELPTAHKDRIYDIASVLLENGFIQDVSLNLPHQLPEWVQNAFSPQIEFLDHLLGSGGHHFESYRSCQAVVVGSDPDVFSLINALFESGLPKIHLACLSPSVNRKRLEEVLAHARDLDPEAELKEIYVNPQSESVDTWREVVRSGDLVFYVSRTANIDRLQQIQTACKLEGKVFSPAMVVAQTGMAGPLIHPESDVTWESAWRRIHEPAISKDAQGAAVSSTAMALLTNTLVFDVFKLTTGITSMNALNRFYLLDLETLEGDWHEFFPFTDIGTNAHPPEMDKLGKMSPHEDPNTQPAVEPFAVFYALTSPVSGIFHTWDEGDLIQLPLAQCRVQPVDPSPSGMAKLLPEIICVGMDHQEVRTEAGWSGIEAYVTKRFDTVAAGEFVGVGTGSTMAQAVTRGLQKWLSHELQSRCQEGPIRLTAVNPDSVLDDKTAYYLEALGSIQQGVPSIALGEQLLGFPVVWVKSQDAWYGSVDLTMTGAFQRALESVLAIYQNGQSHGLQQVHASTEVIFDNEPLDGLHVPLGNAPTQDVLEAAIAVLQNQNLEISIVDLAFEPFLKQIPDVVGVSVKREGGQ